MMPRQVRRPARGQMVAAAQEQRPQQRSCRPRQTRRQRQNQTAQAGPHHGAVTLPARLGCLHACPLVVLAARGSLLVASRWPEEHTSLPGSSSCSAKVWWAALAGSGESRRSGLLADRQSGERGTAYKWLTLSNWTCRSGGGRAARKRGRGGSAGSAGGRRRSLPRNRSEPVAREVARPYGGTMVQVTSPLLLLIASR